MVKNPALEELKKVKNLNKRAVSHEKIPYKYALSLQLLALVLLGVGFCYLVVTLYAHVFDSWTF